MKKPTETLSNPENDKRSRQKRVGANVLVSYNAFSANYDQQAIASDSQRVEEAVRKINAKMERDPNGATNELIAQEFESKIVSKGVREYYWLASRGSGARAFPIHFARSNKMSHRILGHQEPASYDDVINKIDDAYALVYPGEDALIMIGLDATVAGYPNVIKQKLQESTNNYELRPPFGYSEIKYGYVREINMDKYHLLPSITVPRFTIGISSDRAKEINRLFRQGMEGALTEEQLVKVQIPRFKILAEIHEQAQLLLNNLPENETKKRHQLVRFDAGVWESLNEALDIICNFKGVAKSFVRHGDEEATSFNKDVDLLYGQYDRIEAVQNNEGSDSPALEKLELERYETALRVFMNERRNTQSQQGNTNGSEPHRDATFYHIISITRKLKQSNNPAFADI